MLTLTLRRGACTVVPALRGGADASAAAEAVAPSRAALAAALLRLLELLELLLPLLLLDVELLLLPLLDAEPLLLVLLDDDEDDEDDVEADRSRRRASLLAGSVVRRRRLLGVLAGASWLAKLAGSSSPSPSWLPCSPRGLLCPAKATAPLDERMVVSELAATPPDAPRRKGELVTLPLSRRWRWPW